MSREIDVRTVSGRLDEDRKVALNAAADAVSAELPGDHAVRVVSFDTATGNAAVTVSDGATAEPGDYVERALAHVQRISPALGLADEQPPEFAADPQYQQTSTGAVAVHLRQLYKAIPIHDAAETVRFDPDGRLRETAGRTVTVVGDLAPTPLLDAADAVRAAAEHLARPDDDPGPYGEEYGEPPLDLAAFEPVTTTIAGDRPDRLTVLQTPPFEHPITVTLTWFPLDETLRLAWRTTLEVPGGAQWRVLVDAADGQVLLATQVSWAVVGRCDAVLSAGAQRRAVTMPMTADAQGAPVGPGLPAGFPDHWLVDATTAGNAVRAVLAPALTPVGGTSAGGEVTFAAPPDPAAPEALVTNLFVLCNIAHDVLYLLGFRERDGNFQHDNHGRGGRAGDPVVAAVHAGAVFGLANMATPSDGMRPRMNMGLLVATGRHTALDPDIVYHEYAHGLSNRLVGGPLDNASLEAIQSGGLGEGWSDFIACTITGKTLVGDWVRPPLGLRRARYDDDYPDTYADLGSPRFSRVHDIGELWCATLLSLARAIGRWECAQIVVDALKLTAANPSLLAARDAILLAADAFSTARGDDETARAGFVFTTWEVFARFGMGPAAATDGPALSGIVADFTPPPRPSTTQLRAEVAPGLAIPDNDPAGVRSVLVLPDSGPVRELTVTVAITHPWRGDLVVTLSAPDGRRVDLHRRGGGGSDHLRRSWSTAADAALAGLRGAPSGGAWTLAVADHARLDVGTLDRWSLEVEVGESRPAADLAVELGTRIPDGADATTSEVQVELPGLVRTLAVEVDITHPKIGEVLVSLSGPTGKRATLHRRSAQDGDQLRTTYGCAEGEPLAAFVGLEAHGTWTLKVAGRDGGGAGKVNRWRLLCEA